MLPFLFVGGVLLIRDAEINTIMGITRKQAFYFLKKTDLVGISKKFGYKGLSVLTKEEMVRKLLGDRAIKKADVIGQLKHADLKSLCLTIGLKPNGTKKTLIASILGKKVESKSPKRSKPVPKTHIAKKAKTGKKIRTASRPNFTNKKTPGSKKSVKKMSDIKERPERTGRVKNEYITFAPGARIVVRDAEWLVRRVDRTSTGGQALTVTGISELVRDKEAIFLTEIDKNIEILDPVDTKLVRDESSSYQASLLYMESLLRRKSPTDQSIYTGHKAAMDPVHISLIPRSRLSNSLDSGY